MIKVGIVGGTGYTGVELLRLLAQHPDVHLQAITSRTESGIAVSQMFPNLRGRVDVAFSETTIENLSTCEVVFVAAPNGVAMKQVPALLYNVVKMNDLTADFALKNPVGFVHQIRGIGSIRVRCICLRNSERQTQSYNCCG